MSKRTKYTNEPIGELNLIPNFLPSPEKLTLKKKNTKITISLSAESIDYSKDVANKYHMPYQRVIRELLDEYVTHQKGAKA